MVKKARHRLDGMVYAIKVSKKTIRKNSHDEKMAMNEVFAHAALMKHKQVVRYYNSWVESGAVRQSWPLRSVLYYQSLDLHTERVLRGRKSSEEDR